MNRIGSELVVVVGAGGVGKTTAAAALAAHSVEEGYDTLVMTFDPSLRLRDTLGIGDSLGGAVTETAEIVVPTKGAAVLSASLLDARRTFDRLVRRYAPDEEAARRILDNRYYDHLAGGLAGILEYMAVERLYEAWQGGAHRRIVLDTPPTSQALDFLDAPDRIIQFLDSGAIRLALRPWFDASGRLRGTRRLGGLGRRLERYLDEIVGLDLLADMAEFFQAFGPLFDGFRQRATEVRRLLTSDETTFVLACAAPEETHPDTLFFARQLQQRDHRLGPVVVNRVHPMPIDAWTGKGFAVAQWLGERDARGAERLGRLLGERHPVVTLPMEPEDPTDLPALARLGREIARRVFPA